jgi:integrase
VPVIRLLRDTPEAHRKRTPDSQFVFEGDKGRPLNLDNLSRRVIHPAVGRLWRGWHGFRRGLATNLARLGVRDKVIQEILSRDQQDWDKFGTKNACKSLWAHSSVG